MAIGGERGGSEAGGGADPNPASTAPAPSRPQRAWQGWLAGGLVLTLVYVIAPYGLFASAVYVAASLYATLAVAGALVTRSQPFCPRAWWLIAVALGLASAGHAIWYTLDLLGREPFPSPADAFYLAVYPLFIAALWLLGRDSGRNDQALSDSLIVGISAAVLGWALLIQPYVAAPDLSLVQLAVSAAYPVADLIMLPLILRFVFIHRMQVRAHLLLLLGLFAYLAADMLYAHGNSVGWYAPGGWTDALWLIAYSLFGAAAWHPSAVLEPRSRASPVELAGRRVLMLGTAAILVPGIILFSGANDVVVVRVAALGAILLFALIMHRLARLIRQTHRQAAEVERLSRADPLTGAANRRYLHEVLVRETERAQRTGARLSIAFVDLDYFKRFNDSHGHSAGDALLRELAANWAQRLRAPDLLARFGGEEFLLVLPNTEADAARAVMQRLQARVPQEQTCSVGIATFEPGETIDGFIGRADQALYAAKAAGRARIEMAR